MPHRSYRLAPQARRAGRRIPAFIRALFLFCVVVVGCGAHNRKGGDLTGSASEALSFTGIGDAASVTPSVLCVASFTTPIVANVVVFRASNISNQSVVIPLGPTNQIMPASPGSGPPTVFATGTQYFTGSFGGFFVPVTWTLGSRTATASVSSPACPITQGPLGPVVQTDKGDVSLRLDPEKVLANTVLPTETETNGLPEGAVPAAFSVTSDGAASYVVNLWTPPGRGVQPNLSLVYNSRAGASILGVGWQL